MVGIEKIKEGVEGGEVEGVKQVACFPGDVGIFDF